MLPLHVLCRYLIENGAATHEIDSSYSHIFAVPNPISPLCTGGTLPAAPNVCVEILGTCVVIPSSTVFAIHVVTEFVCAPGVGD